MPPTNLLWIMADDLGVGEPSYTGNKWLRTPNIDRLAASGMTFSAAYAGYTVCAPSRATLFTGRNSGHFAKTMPGDWPLLPQLLKDAGYETAAFGKSAPMDAAATPTELRWGLPSQHGFDHYEGQANQGYCHNMYPIHWTVGEVQTRLPLNAKHKSREACMAHPGAYNYTTDLFADAAIAWLHSRQIPLARPFFAYLSFTVPHAGGWGSYPKAPEEGQPVPTDMGFGKRPPRVEPLLMGRDGTWDLMGPPPDPSHCHLGAR